MKHLAGILAAAVLASGNAAQAQDAMRVGYLREWPVPVLAIGAEGLELPADSIAFALSPYDSPTELLDAVTSGEVDLALSVPTIPLFEHWTAGAPLEVIGMSASYPHLDQCVVDEGISFSRTNARNLRDARVAVPVGTIAHYSLVRQLDQLGITPDEVEVLDMEPRLAAQAFINRDAEIACAWGRPLEAMLEFGKPLMSVAEKVLIGVHSFDSITVRQDWLADNPDTAEAFLRINDVMVRIGKSQDLAPAIAEKVGLDVATTKAMLDSFIYPDLIDQTSATIFGGGVQSYLSALSAFLTEQGTFETAIAKDSLAVTTSVIEAAMALLPEPEPTETPVEPEPATEAQ